MIDFCTFTNVVICCALYACHDGYTAASYVVHHECREMMNYGNTPFCVNYERRIDLELCGSVV